MSSSDALPKTLLSITTTKFEELSKQRDLFNKEREAIVKAAADAPDLVSRARLLLEGVSRLKGHANAAHSTCQVGIEDGSDRSSHINIHRFLNQREYDPSISDWVVQNWITEMEQEIKYLGVPHEHAAFYTKLVTQWLTHIDNKNVKGNDEANDEAVEETTEETDTSRTEMQEQRAIWEDYVFSEKKVEKDSINEYLDSLFARAAPIRVELEELRTTIKSFGEELSSRKVWITNNNLEKVTSALLNSDLLTKEKTTILKDLTQDPAVAQEVADVLNMRLASLRSWGWGDEPLPLEMRRQLNGKYRFFTDMDLIDNIMLQYLGLEWSIVFRRAFETFSLSPAWTTLHSHTPRSLRSQFQKCELPFSFENLNSYRQKQYRDEYFLTQLPKDMEGGPDYDADNNKPGVKTALDIKQSLLHMLVAESLIHTALRGQFTALRSDFKYFGPSLSHDTILCVLAYFGVPSHWLDFFNTFLKMPMKFPENEGRVRQRGVPMSFTLSVLFGEAVLFCMDYAVNQAVNGCFLYRLHDDFWFWGSDRECAKAWQAMTKFTQVLGLELNDDKTGTVRITRRAEDWFPLPTVEEAPADWDLPEGDITWGLLKLDAQSGRFVICQHMVDKHIEELKRQLKSRTSIFAWIGAWNSYFARFFPNNFAKPAFCFGRNHITMALTTLSRIEKAAMQEICGRPCGVTDCLRQMIKEQLGEEQLPDGVFFFPVELGGLEVMNPYIPLLAMRDSINEEPEARLLTALIRAKVAYKTAKKSHGRKKSKSSQSDSEHSSGDEDSESGEETGDPRFPSWNRYMSYLEGTSDHLLSAYKALIEVPSETAIARSRSFQGIHTSVSTTLEGGTKITNSWISMNAYWRWTAELYHRDMVEKFGGLAAVNRQYMPLGVVNTLRSGRTRWTN
eukprot:Blabericola_migrator_1__11049@NODE_642_length_7106_cov_1724_731212_g82_i1_p1_GENE_NODE_642_length_7106_cov_1724_731212_g82_i1NODE_642_length_7106_cov_1724_731212_g82_i1_p1_ORF_typecomplete_len902_score141_51RVT_1/PF00078_27/9_3e02RVT_1/PF00078_27/2_7e14UPF0184/PF03670_13/1UPF0184/PF03670_13/1e03_NODE_642_length_7106_cov_1724_731212_g82_i121874892